MKKYLSTTLIKLLTEIAKKGIKPIVVLLLMFSTIAAFGASTIIKNSQTNYSIYVGNTTTVAEKNAATELQKYLKAATGVIVPISSKYSGSKQIIVGLQPELSKLLPKINTKTLKPDEIIIYSSGNNLILAGARPRGSLYAVYTFLEDYLGIKFWTANEQTIPHLTKVELPEISFRYAPRIEIRAPYTYNLIHTPSFAVQCKVFGPTYKLPEAWGGSIELIGPWHTFDRFLPVGQYIKSNPEYFSLRNGKRIGGQFKGQLCLSNPKLREKFLSIVLDKLRKHPDPKFISVTQNDNENYCQCATCAKIDKAGGGPSASIINFINFIAKNVEKEFPQVIVQTFAYQYSRQVPSNIKPRHNVSIFFCTMGSDYSKAFDDTSSKLNKAFMRDINTWSRISSNLDIWDYVANFSNFLYPHPNFDAIKKNIKILGQHKPHMLMLQGDYLNPNDIGDMQALRTWVISKLLWNSDLDGDKLENEFVSGYYGAAASKVTEYLALRRKAVERNTKVVSCFMYTTPWLDNATLFKGLKVLEEAKKIVINSPILLKRIKKLAKSFEYALLKQYNRLKSNKACPSRAKVAKIAKEYLNFLLKNKVTYISEETPIDSTLALCRRLAKNRELRYQKSTFLNKFKKGSYIVFEEDSFTISGGSKVGKIVEDPKASNGLAIKIFHDVYGWGIKLPVQADMLNGVEYDFYAAVRLPKRAKAGLYEFGAYDLGNRKLYLNKHPDANEVLVNKYTYIPLGSGKLLKNSYIFFAPKVNPQIKVSFLDHIVFVKKQ